MRSTISTRTALVVLALATAVALGSVGTASASGLTKGAVRKIAVKTLARQAAALSVSHANTADSARTAAKADTADTATRADTAGDADTINGAHAAELGVRPIVYELNGLQDFGLHKTWTLTDTPPGTYLVGLHAILTASGPTPITWAHCWLVNLAFDDRVLDAYAPAMPDHTAPVTGTGALVVKAGNTVQLGCEADQPFGDGLTFPRLTLTPAASYTLGTLTPAP
jgi:hypothetical protein